MIKNIIILILVGLVAYFLIANGKPQQYLQNDKSNAGTTQQSAKPSVNDNSSGITVSGKSLDLSGQGLNKLPSYVLDETSLEELNISHNNLTGALPAEIRHLSNLKVLDASDNQMTGVPAEIGQLEKLEILDLSNNKLTGLPYEMGNLRNLKTLNLSGNDYSEHDLEIIKQGLSSDVQIIL